MHGKPPKNSLYLMASQIMTDCGEIIRQNAPFLIKELGSKVQCSKVQRLIPSFNYPYGINGIRKKREVINPER